MSKKQLAIFDDRFLESFAGSSIIKDPLVAVLELIANAWDAGATAVDIKWPILDGDEFSISDNGHGIREKDFLKRYGTLAYNRVKEQGIYAEVPKSNQDKISKRSSFGKNGKGRLGGFAFGEEYYVETWCEGRSVTFKVFKDQTTNTLAFTKVGDSVSKEGHGTRIYVVQATKPKLEADDARREICMRFLADPHFSVEINGKKISFDDIPSENIDQFDVEVDGFGVASVTAIDVQVTDRTTQLHGIAWHVNRRLVGECSWKGSGSEHLLDRRRIAAKRYAFIVEADFLAGGDTISPDWTTFIPTSEGWKKTSEVVYSKIRDYILDATQEQRNESFNSVLQASKPLLNNLGMVSRQKWETFIHEVQVECPSIAQDDLEKLGSLLAKLELSESKFGIIRILSNSTIEEIDTLYDLLQKWEIDFAKVVLDEIQFRTTLLQKLQSKVLNTNTDEVQELQPLFYRGLWIFGPEYESIEYTSNKGMTSVIQILVGALENERGSRKRPDFVITPDGTVGLYSISSYDNDGGENGIDRLTIVELKKPGIKISTDEKGQTWKYVKELLDKGFIGPKTKVVCFVLGSEIDPSEASERTELDQKVRIVPLNYDTVVRRANSRLLKLYDKIVNVSFLKDERLRQYLEERAQKELFEN